MGEEQGIEPFRTMRDVESCQIPPSALSPVTQRLDLVLKRRFLRQGYGFRGGREMSKVAPSIAQARLQADRGVFIVPFVQQRGYSTAPH